MRLNGRRLGEEVDGRLDLSWERDVPLALYLKALDALG
jgi:hypothetical protein